MLIINNTEKESMLVLVHAKSDKCQLRSVL